MTGSDNCFEKPHILQHFDQELNTIHQLSLAMLRRLIDQWDKAITAIATGDREQAIKIVARSIDIRKNQNKVDQNVLSLLARENPVASDLRMVFSLSKISLTLKYLGDDLSEIGKFSLLLSEQRSSAISNRLIEQVVAIAQTQREAYYQVEQALSQLDTQPAYPLFERLQHCNEQVHQALQQLLGSIQRDPQSIRPLLSMIQIIKLLESCNDHCRNLAEYCIYMIAGEDLRHCERTVPAIL